MKKLIFILIVLSGCIKNIDNLKLSHKNINDDLIDASKCGDLNQITSLLSQKANVNYRNK